MPDLDSDLAIAVAGLRADSARVDWPQAPEIRVRGDRRATRHRVAGAAVAVLACAALVAVMIVARPALRAAPRPPAATSPTGLGSAVLRSLTSYVHDTEATAIAVGEGSLWLAYRANFEKPGPVPGELVRLDLASLNVVSRWPIVSSPSSVVVTSAGVWVAGDIFDGKVDVLGPDTVQEFTLDGTLRRTYDIVSPFELAADPTDGSVWVRHGRPTDEGTYVSNLNEGVAKPITPLSGANPLGGPAIVACPDGIYAASQNFEASSTRVQRFGGNRVASEAIVDGTGFVSLACAETGVNLAVTSQSAAVYRLDFGGGSPTKLLDRLPTSQVLAVSSGLMWLDTVQPTGDSRVWALDPRQVLIGVGVDVPAGLTSAAAEGGTVWAIGFDTRRPGETIIAVITVS